MIQIAYKGDFLEITDSNKTSIQFLSTTGEVILDGFDINFPGEYEKSGILWEVKEYSEILFFKFLIDGKKVAIITSDSFEIKEEILKFFGDIDILVIVGSKQSVKVFENIEAKVVVPYGEGKDIFLNTVGNHADSVQVYKAGADISGDNTEFVNLEK